MKFPDKKSSLVLLVALIALIVPVVLLEQAVWRHTDGHVVFPTDNAFIDITVGRNLTYYKVWGISKYSFQPVSSSLLYPLVLVPAFFIAGEYLLVPVVVNGLLAVILLFVVQRALIRAGVKPMVQLVILLAVITAAALPLLVVSGMGYLLLLLTAFLFVDGLGMSLAADRPRLPARIYLSGVLMIASGSETILVLVFAVVMLYLAGRKKESWRLGLVSVLPIALFGAISLSTGNAFLPVSLLPSLYPPIACLLAVIAVFVGAASIRQWHRLAASRRPVSIYRVTASLLCLLALPFLLRNFVVLGHFTRDSTAVYEAEYRLASFIHRYYKMAPVGVNDIGAVAWFSDGKKLDFTGLTSADVAQVRKDHDWTPEWADSLSRKNYVSTLMVSDPWFRPEAFPDWARVASWKFPDSPSGPGKTLSFYIRNRQDTFQVRRIRRNLLDYQKRLSKDIDVQYY